MFERDSHSVDPGRLARAARRDGRRLTPGFSPALHARILQSIDRCDVAAEQSSAKTHRAGGEWIRPLARAAILALLISPAMVLLSGPANPPAAKLGGTANRTDPVAAVAPVVVPAVVPAVGPSAAPRGSLSVFATADDVNARVRRVVDDALAEHQFAGLDHDVRSATRYLVDQVPLRSIWEGAVPLEAH